MRMTSSGGLHKFFDPGLMLTLLLACFNIVPLESNPGLPNGADTLYHSFRVAEMWRSWEHGVLAPSSAEVFYFGNDSLFFPVDVKLTYFLIGAIHLVLGLGAFDAIRWLLLLSLLTCSGGMYLFCKRRSGRLGALMAGLLYVYSPHLMYTAAYARGAYPELLAFALFPIFLWRIDALRDRTSAANFLWVFLLQLALIHAHSPSALTLTAIAVAWIVFETAIQRFNREASQMKARNGLLALLVMLIGILGAAGSWLPIQLESESLGFETVSDARLIDYSAAFVRLETLLSPAPINDAGAINGLRELPILGAAQWIAALTGAFGAALLYIRGYRTRHPQAFLGAAYFSLLSLALIFLSTPASLGIWESLHPLRFLPFTWRLLGPLAVCLAIVGSVNGIWLERMAMRYRIGAAALAVALPIVTIVPLLFVPEWRHSDADSSIDAYHEQASLGRQIGAAFTDEFRPRDVSTTPAGNVSSVASAVSVFGLVLALWFLRKREQTMRPYWTVPSLSRTSLIGILLGGGIALLTFAVTFREGIAWLKSPPGEALPAQIQRKYTLDDNLQLLGYDISSERARPGETLEVNLYWYALAETDIDFSSFLRLSSGGQPFARIDKPHPGGRAISDWWRPEGYIFDQYALLLPRDIPPGDYELITGLYTCALTPAGDCGEGYRPIARDEDGNLIGDSIVLGAIRVDAP